MDAPTLTPNAKVPVELEEVKVTVPVGEAPETVAVQVVDEPAEPDGAGVVDGRQDTEVLEAAWVSGDTLERPEATLGAGVGLARATGEVAGKEEMSGDMVLTMKSAARAKAWARAGRRMFTRVMVGSRPAWNQKARPGPEGGTSGAHGGRWACGGLAAITRDCGRIKITQPQGLPTRTDKQRLR